MLKFENITKSFAIEKNIFGSKTGKVVAVSGVSFELQRGKTAALVGESGSGKTTLGKIACGLIKADFGEVYIDGIKIGAYPRKQLSTKVQMIFQDPYASLNPKLSVGTTLLEAALHLKVSERLSAVNEILGIIGLGTDVLKHYPHQFSGGQRQRIAIARALIKKPELIIADEPLSSLDITTQNQLLNIFKSLKEKLSVSFLFITHDFAAASNIADRIIVMKNGNIVEDGAADSVIGNPKNQYTKALLSAVPAF